MNVLDSPVEVLAFNYLSFGLNNLWTWLALFTAALSFWRIRTTGYSKHDPVRDPVHDQKSELFDSVTPVVEPVVEEPVATAVTGGVSDEDVDGVRKGKFTVYYEEDEVQCSRDDESEGSLMVWGERRRELLGCEEAEWWERWERLLRWRNGESDDGWYTWQDLTELNGNVVRLWDGGFRCRESWYSSSCVHVW